MSYWQESEPTINEFISRNPEPSDREWSSFCEQNLNQLDSYKALENDGWRGYVHPKLMDYYRGRIKNNPHWSVEDSVDRAVFKYFSTLLLHRQWGFFQGESSLPSPIKLAFVGLSPGSPPAVKDSPRIDLRILPKTVTKRNMVPWACKGIIRIDGGKVRPTLRNHSEVEELGDRLLESSLILSRGDEELRVRADALPMTI